MTTSPQGTSPLATWAAAVRASALVGTSKRPAPALPDALRSLPDAPPSTANTTAAAITGAGGQAQVVEASGRAPGSANNAPAHPSLLDQIALLDVLTRAGTVPVSGTPVDPAPPNRRPDAPPEAVQLLTLLVRQSPLPASARDQQIDHWLDRCAEAGFSVQAGLLPELVALAHSRVAMRVPLARVWDERGRWYAGLFAPRMVRSDAGTPDPAATPAGPADAASEVAELSQGWATRSADLARAHLRRVRYLDAEAGRALLAQHWRGFSAKERAVILDALRTGLGPADEPFLEAALDDRSKGVRAAAVQLLRQLPGSGLNHRMAQRMAPLITVTKRFLRDPLLTVTPPAAIDEAGIRDGLEAPSASGQRPHLSWLQTIITGAPLATWCEVTGLTPEKIVKLLASDELVLGTVARAVGMQEDAAWAAALTASGRHGSLVGLLPPEQQIRWLSEALHTGPVEPDQFLRAARNTPHPWPAPLARAIAERIAAAEDADRFVRAFDETLYPGFGPEVAAVIDRLEPSENQRRARTILLAVRQNASFARSIDEAFPPRRNPR
ncbi:MAG: DUF5691 domain-containing protein [Propioniciclava sp.]|uniref:DUF5691 domain-containing protein n=1 Tax=Propioniciclava sp. TaxID=2038686 RepID=UPI0039E57DB2